MGSEPKYVFLPDEELGRWICPCNCTGTQKWVHEGCLKEWRFHHANNKHFYECHTCKSRYEFARMSWAERVRSPLLSLALTLIIFFMSVFLLGFVADPILSLWLDPAGTIVDGFSSVSGAPLERELYDFDDFEDGDWWDHWLKGFFSLGVVGMFKAFLAMSPWHWWNLRNTGVLGGRARRGKGPSAGYQFRPRDLWGFNFHLCQQSPPPPLYSTTFANTGIGCLERRSWVYSTYFGQDQ